MKNHIEIYKCLIDGGMLISSDGCKVKLDPITGFLINEKGFRESIYFDRPENWKEYKDTQWYNNIPDEGILCWVDDYNDYTKDTATIIKSKKLNFIGLEGSFWKFATPVKPEECFQCLSNENVSNN